MRPFFVVGFLLFFGSGVLALQSADAELWVSQNQFLDSGENAVVFRALLQVDNGDRFWLVSVLNNGVLRTIIPIRDSGEIVDESVLRTDLVSANFLVQNIVSIKSQQSWLVSLSNSNSLEELSNALENEQFDLDVVSSALLGSSHSSLVSDVSDLKTLLLRLSGDVRGVSDNVELLNGLEIQQFNAEIDTSVLLGLDDDYFDLFDSIETIQSVSNEYDSLVIQLKNGIASSDSLDSTEKSQLIDLLSPLGVGQTVGSSISGYASLAADNRQRIETEFASYPSSVSAMEAELNNRLLRSKAYFSIYLEDSFLKKNTRYSTLADASATILDSSNKPYWENQSDVLKLDAVWPKILGAFSKKDYQAVLDFSSGAKQLVKKIDEAGVKDTSQNGPLLSDNVVLGLGVVLVIVVLFIIIQPFLKKPKIPSEKKELDPFVS